MRELASGTLAGPEARGQLRVVEAPDGTRAVEITDLWVAPGAPDVRLFASVHRAGAVDETSTELGPVPYGQPNQTWVFPPSLGVSGIGSIVVYCHIYSAYFGHAELDWVSP